MALGGGFRDNKGMFGYFFAGIIGIIVLGFLFVGLSGNKPSEHDTKGGRPGQNPAKGEKPFADEPTPDQSVTASRGQVDSAKRKIPPA